MSKKTRIDVKEGKMMEKKLTLEKNRENNKTDIQKKNISRKTKTDRKNETKNKARDRKYKHQEGIKCQGRKD